MAVMVSSVQFGLNSFLHTFFHFPARWPNGEHVGLMIWLRQTFFPGYFRVSLLLKHVRKAVVAMERKLCLYWCEKAKKHVHHQPP